MKKLLSYFLLLALLTGVSSVFAQDLVTVPASIKTQLDTIVAKIPEEIRTSKLQAVLGKIETLLAKKNLNAKTTRLLVIVKAYISNYLAEADTTLEEVFNTPVTTPTPTPVISSNYPGCKETDITIGNQIWAGCNVGATVSNEAWDYFEWGDNVSFDNNINGTVNYSKSQTPWGQGPCAKGYHVPLKSEYLSAYKTSDYSIDQLQKNLNFYKGGYNDGYHSAPSPFQNKGKAGYMWIDSPYENNFASYSWYVRFWVNTYWDGSVFDYTEKYNFFNIRCIKD